MKLVNARTLAEALAGTWMNKSQRTARLENRREAPPELRALAERSRTFAPTNYNTEPNETP